MGQSIHVYVDFDGTISSFDTTDILLQRFADPSWIDVEAAWERGEIGSRECLVRQIDLLRVSPDALAKYIASVQIDPDFRAFVRLCRSLAIPVTIVSDGIDRTIQGVLARLRLKLPVLANRLEWAGEDRWRISFPFAREDCAALSGHCKCHSVGREHLRVLIGDGQSDYCAAEAADMVFAKGRLVGHCGRLAVPHLPFSTFADLGELFAGWARAASLGRVPEVTSRHKEQTYAE